MQAPTVIAMAISETTRFSVTWVTVFCLSGDVRVPIFLAHSLEVIISILNSMIHDDDDFLSWRAFFRYPLRCYCRLFVSDYVPFSFSNQLVAIGSRMKWRFRQLLFPSANWFGDEIWLFDPSIFRIDNEDELKTGFTLTPVHNAVSRQRQRIWWRKIMLYLILRISHGTLLICISVSIKDLGRPPVVSLILGGCISGTRFTRWLSSLPQSWSLAITKKDVPFCCCGIFVWKQCTRRWIGKLWKRITSYGEVGVLFSLALVLVDVALRMRTRRSHQQHTWIYGTITKHYISFSRRAPISMVLRCNGWIADCDFRKRKRWFIEKMFPKLGSHTRLTDKTKATKHMIQIAAPQLFCFFVTRICDCISIFMSNITIFCSN